MLCLFPLVEAITLDEKTMPETSGFTGQSVNKSTNNVFSCYTCTYHLFCWMQVLLHRLLFRPRMS